MPQTGPRDARRRHYGSVGEAKAGEVDREAVLDWWREMTALAEGEATLDADVSERIADAVHSWGFGECTLALELVSAALVSGAIYSPVAGRLQSSLRMRLDVLKAGLLAPHIPEAILVPFVGVEHLGNPAELTDDLRQRVSVPDELRPEPSAGVEPAAG